MSESESDGFCHPLLSPFVENCAFYSKCQNMDINYSGMCDVMNKKICGGVSRHDIRVMCMYVYNTGKLTSILTLTAERDFVITVISSSMAQALYFTDVSLLFFLGVHEATNDVDRRNIKKTSHGRSTMCALK